MPETFREYPIMELGLAVADTNDLASGHERKQEGDIIYTRRVHKGTGSGVRSDTLLVLVEGWDFDDYAKLSHINGDIQNGPEYAKRRFCLPFKRLPAWVDLARVRDPNDVYQPWQPIDTDTNLFLEGASLPPLWIDGLILDKKTDLFL